MSAVVETVLAAVPVLEVALALTFDPALAAHQALLDACVVGAALVHQSSCPCQTKNGSNHDNERRKPEVG